MLNTGGLALDTSQALSYHDTSVLILCSLDYRRTSQCLLLVALFGCKAKDGLKSYCRDCSHWTFLTLTVFPSPRHHHCPVEPQHIFQTNVDAVDATLIPQLWGPHIRTTSANASSHFLDSTNVPKPWDAQEQLV